MALRLLAALLMAACTPLGPSPARTTEPALAAPCPSTLTHARPPDVVVEFMRGGTSPQPSYDQFVAGPAQANWAGNDTFWVSLPNDGVIRPTFPPARDAGWKFWSYATAPGDPNAPHYGSYEVTASAQTLDRSTPAGFVGYFNGANPIGHGPGFLATGLIFPAAGCWQVTYSAGAGASGPRSFTFVVEVKPT
jgi:hypothetical protein